MAVLHRVHTSGLCSTLEQLPHGAALLLSLPAAASSVLGIWCLWAVLHMTRAAAAVPSGPGTIVKQTYTVAPVGTPVQSSSRTRNGVAERERRHYDFERYNPLNILIFWILHSLVRLFQSRAPSKWRTLYLRRGGVSWGAARALRGGPRV